MKIKTLFCALLSLITLTVHPMPECLASNDRVPNDWFQLPEDGGKDPAFLLDPICSLSLKKTLKNLLVANNQAFEGVTSLAPKRPSGNEGHPRDWKPWSLDAYTFDLSISVGGILGTLLLDGSSSVKEIWTRVEESKNLSPKFHQLKKDPADIIITSGSEPLDVSKQLEGVIRGALSTGLIQNEQNFRKNMTQAVQQFQALTSHLEKTEANVAWPLFSFRTELNIDASGEVHPGIRVGSSVNIRLDWFRSTSIPLPVNKEIGKNLPEFIKMLSEDLLTVSQEDNDIKGVGYSPDFALIAIGITAEGDIGIIGAGSTLTGTLVFERTSNDPTHVQQPIGKENRFINLISDRSQDNQRIYAEKHGITYERRTAINAAQGEAILYRVDRSKFRKGLRRAIKLSEFFINETSKVKPIKNFQSSEIDTAFSVSVSGTLGQVTVGGFAGLEIDFIKSNP